MLNYNRTAKTRRIERAFASFITREPAKGGAVNLFGAKRTSRFGSKTRSRTRLQFVVP